MYSFFVAVIIYINYTIDLFLVIGERSEPHTYRTVGKNLRHIYIYIYIRPCDVHVPLTRYAQTSDWPVEVQRSI